METDHSLNSFKTFLLLIICMLNLSSSIILQVYSISRLDNTQLIELILQLQFKFLVVNIP